MKKKNAILSVLFLFAMSVALPSCAPTEQCWAYKSTSKYNDHKKRPSVAGAMNKKRAKLRH